MYSVEFYEDSNGVSNLWNYLEELRLKSSQSKDAHIQYKQLIFYIELLQRNGTNLPVSISKHLFENIWELRPGKNRVLYFYHQNNTFILLHHFRKKTQKTPQSEIERAIKERNDYLKQKERNSNNENME